MRYFSAAIFLVAALFLESSQAEDLSTQVQQANERVTAPTNSEPCLDCQHSASAEFQQQANACLRALCPDPIQTSEFVTLEGAAMGSEDARYLEQAFPLIDSIQNEEFRHQLIMKEALKSWLPTAPNITSEADIAAFNLLATIHWDSNMARFRYDSENPFDREATRAELSGPNADAELARIEHYFKENFRIPFTRMTDSTHVGLSFSNDTELREAVDNAISEYDQNLKWVRDNSRSPAVRQAVAQMPTAVDLRRGFATEIRHPRNLNILGERLLSSRLLRQVATPGPTLNRFRSQPININDFSERRNISSDLSNDIELLGAYQSTEKVLNSMTCDAAFGTAQLILPSRAELGQMRRMADDTVERFIDKTDILLSPQTKAALKSSMNEWKASLPQSKEDHAEQFLQALRDFKADLQARNRAEEALLESPNKDAIMQLELFNVTSTQRGEFLVVEPHQFCANLTPVAVSDAALFSTNLFSVGPVSLRHPEYGVNVIAHELGHLLYNQLENHAGSSTNSKQWFESTKSCLVGQHDESGSQYLMEDWADFVSAKIALSPKNTACMLYNENSAGALLQFSLSTTSDSHSSPLFRLLNFEVQRGREIPAQCAAALRTKGEQTTAFRSCPLPSSP